MVCFCPASFARILTISHTVSPSQTTAESVGLPLLCGIFLFLARKNITHIENGRLTSTLPYFNSDVHFRRLIECLWHGKCTQDMSYA